MAEAAPTIPEAGPVLKTAEIIELSEFVGKRSERLGKVIDELEAGVKQRAAAQGGKGAARRHRASDR